MRIISTGLKAEQKVPAKKEKTEEKERRGKLPGPGARTSTNRSALAPWREGKVKTPQVRDSKKEC